MAFAFVAHNKITTRISAKNKIYVVVVGHHWFLKRLFKRFLQKSLSVHAFLSRIFALSLAGKRYNLVNLP